MPGITEALATIQTELEGKGRDSPEVKAAVQELRKTPVGSALYNIGFSKGEKSKENDPKVASLTTDLEAARVRVTELEQQVADIQKKQPDVAALTTQHQEALAKLKREHKEALEAKDAVIVEVMQEAGLDTFELEIVEAGADKDWANTVGRGLFKDRFDAKPDKTLRVLSEDGVPYEGKTKRDMVKALAADAAKVVPPKFMTVKAEPGAGGRHSNNNSGGGGGRGSAADIESRKKEKIETERLSRL